MTYIVKKADGSTLTTVAEGTIDTTACSVGLLGRKATDYGLTVAENFVKLVENFASDVAPTAPLRGQFWFEKTAKRLRIYDGTTWFTMMTITADGATVTGTQLISTAVSPLPPMTVASSVKVDGLNADLLDGYNTSITAVPSTIAVRNSSGDLIANVFQGVATSARYADLAERYEASEPLEAGDVVCIGGEKEIRKTTVEDTAMGVISAHPGVRMNEDAGSDDTHPFVAYVGRVPVKVAGPVKKGEPLTVSDIPGVATRGAALYGLVIGRALETKTTEEVGLVLAAIGVK